MSCLGGGWRHSSRTRAHYRLTAARLPCTSPPRPGRGDPAPAATGMRDARRVFAPPHRLAQLLNTSNNGPAAPWGPGGGPWAAPAAAAAEWEQQCSSGFAAAAAEHPGLLWGLPLRGMRLRGLGLRFCQTTAPPRPTK
jgi:hypothetical protein